METLKQRLLLLIEELGITKAQFEKIVGLSNGFVDKSGDNTRRKSLDKISNTYPNVNVSWLLTGEGPMFNQSGGIVQAGVGNVNNSVIENSSITNNIDNRHYYSDSPDVLRAEIDKLDRILAEKEDRIAEKDKQIAEKDKQIAALIAALGK